MEIGSIVECVDDSFNKRNPRVSYPVKGKMYIVRSVINSDYTFSGQPGILLEEITNPTMMCQTIKGPRVMEPSFKLIRFREVDFNIDELRELAEQPFFQTV